MLAMWLYLMIKMATLESDSSLLKESKLNLDFNIIWNSPFQMQIAKKLFLSKLESQRLFEGCEEALKYDLMSALLDNYNIVDVPDDSGQNSTVVNNRNDRGLVIQCLINQFSFVIVNKK